MAPDAQKLIEKGLSDSAAFFGVGSAAQLVEKHKAILVYLREKIF